MHWLSVNAITYLFDLDLQINIYIRGVNTKSVKGGEKDAQVSKKVDWQKRGKRLG